MLTILKNLNALMVIAAFEGQSPQNCTTSKKGESFKFSYYVTLNVSNIIVLVLRLKLVFSYLVSYSQTFDYCTPLPFAVFVILRIDNH